MLATSGEELLGQFCLKFSSKYPVPAVWRSPCELRDMDPRLKTPKFCCKEVGMVPSNGVQRRPLSSGVSKRPISGF
jgi:hypothetical protein